MYHLKGTILYYMIVTLPQKCQKWTYRFLRTNSSSGHNKQHPDSTLNNTSGSERISLHCYYLNIQRTGLTCAYSPHYERDKHRELFILSSFYVHRVQSAWSY